MKNKTEFYEYPENPESIKLKIHELLEELSITEDLKKRISILGLVGVHQRSLMLLKEAEGTLNEVLDLISKNDLSFALYAQNKIRIAHVYQWQKNFNLSNAVFEEIIKLCLENEGASQYLHFAYQHHGKNLFDQDRYEEAHEFLKKALAIRLDLKVPSDQLESTMHAIGVVEKYLSSLRGAKGAEKVKRNEIE